MSCQDLCLSGWYDGSNDFFRDKKNRVARKQYKCEECRGVIAVGDKHYFAAGKTEGFFWEHRSCAACAEIRSVFYCGGGATFGELWEDVRDQMFPRWNEMTAIDCLARLTTDAAIAKMRAKYIEYLEDRDS